MTDQQGSGNRRWSRWMAAAIIAALPFIYLGFTAGRMFLFPPRLQIGPETTVVDGPLRADGTVDYVAVLNEERSRGVTVENNAVVLLARALGPRVFPAEIRKSWFDLLGIAVPPAEGDYLITLEEFLNQQEIEPDRVNEIVQSLSPAAPFTAEERPEVAAWITASSGPADLIVAASRREEWYSPLVIPPGSGGLLEVPLSLEQETRTGARLLSARAMLRLGSGDVEGAVEDAMACHRLGRLMTRHPLLIANLVGYALDGVAASATEQVILSGRLTPEQARRFREEFDALPEFSTMLRAIDRGERFTCLDATLQTVKGTAAVVPLPGRLTATLDPNVMLKRFNKSLDDIAALLRIEDVPTRLQRQEEWDEELRTRAAASRNIATIFLGWATNRRTAVSNAVAEVLVSLMMPANRQAQIAEDRTRMRTELIRLGWGLAEHHAAAGEFPERLGQLVPDRVTDIPLDLFNGQPLNYERHADGFLLYSVGPNGLDDGGRSSGPSDRPGEACDDILFGRPVPGDAEREE